LSQTNSATETLLHGASLSYVERTTLRRCVDGWKSQLDCLSALR